MRHFINKIQSIALISMASLGMVACEDGPLPFQMAKVTCECIGDVSQGTTIILRQCVNKTEEQFKNQLKQFSSDERLKMIQDYKKSFKDCAGESIAGLSVKYALNETLNKDLWSQVGSALGVKTSKDENGNVNIDLDGLAESLGDFGEAVGESIGQEFDEEFAEELGIKMQKIGESIEKQIDNKNLDEDFDKLGEQIGKAFENIAEDFSKELEKNLNESFKQSNKKTRHSDIEDSEYSRNPEAKDFKDATNSMQDIKKEIDDIGQETERLKNQLQNKLTENKKPD